MAPTPTDDKLKSLAQAVACGRTAQSWAVKHHTPVELADEWCMLPEFRGLVDAHRNRVHDRLSGKLMTRAEVAMDEIFTALRCGTTDHVKLRAGSILIDKWLQVSRRFEVRKRLAELTELLARLEQESANMYKFVPSGSKLK